MADFQVKPKGIYLLAENAFEQIYGPEERRDIEALAEMSRPPLTAQSWRENPVAVGAAEIIFSGWGCPAMDEDFLRAAPNLKAVFYGAGSVRKVVSEAFWKRGILISSARAANAVPVAEYTISQVLFCLKGGWRYVLSARARGGFVSRDAVVSAGACGSTVGLVSLGMIGRRVARLLGNFDLEVIACDPLVPPDDASALGVRLCPLEEVFARADVVSLHTPWLKETEGLVTGRHLALMKPGAAFINTARGAVVREAEMFAVLRQRPDITAVLDVAVESRPPDGAPHYTLPNVVFTPHIAGSAGRECRRMGRFAAAELGRYLRGEPLSGRVAEQEARFLA